MRPARQRVAGTQLVSILRSFWRRLWILGGLLLVVCALGWVQYRWINQLAQAHRQAAQANLVRELSNLENDFDIEVTRAFRTFQVPGGDPNYSERYQQWVRRAPYPELILGVYVFDLRSADAALQPLAPGEPFVESSEWREGLKELAVDGAPEPNLTIDGNPAFLIPVIKVAGALAAPHAVGTGRPIPAFSLDGRWILVVLNADYIKRAFLPSLVNAHFQKGAKSEYDVVVVDGNPVTRERTVFRSEWAPSEAEFTHPDGQIQLFRLRPDCFPPPSLTSGVGDLRPQAIASRDILSDILDERPSACSDSGPAMGGSRNGLWSVLIRYRAGSLDQATTAFRDRNLLISGSVLLVLALGMCISVVTTERARSLAEMQTRFVLSVSHELRTPLTVIRVAADNLTRGMVENQDKAHQYGEIIQAQASELSEMVEEILTLARLQSTALVRSRNLASPQHIVMRALAGCEGALRGASINVELRIAPDQPLISVDVRLLERCLRNLLQNAIKYAADGGWIGVEITRINRREGESVQISVEDRGPGIAAVDLPHIFEPFYRGHAAADSLVPGVGLGLVVVKRIVEDHRGAVDVETSEGRGAKFSIYLPVQASEKATLT
jgi:two-component system sensor histidine kinase SenX3